MVPVWKADREHERIYGRVHVHSAGMVSVGYEPPSADALQLVRQYVADHATATSPACATEAAVTRSSD